MWKKCIIAIVAVFIVLSIIDFVVHGLILRTAYEQTAHLWRAPEEMKLCVTYLVTFAISIIFVVIYATLIKPKSIAAGLKLGSLFGLAWGISMGFGSYSYMPISVGLASVWFLSTLVRMVLAGLITAAIVKTSD